MQKSYSIINLSYKINIYNTKTLNPQRLKTYNSNNIFYEYKKERHFKFFLAFNSAYKNVI